MAKNISYPTAEKIVEYNMLALTLLKVKKADKPEVMSSQKLRNVIEECRALEGDVYDKAALLLMGLVKAHAFASGNRRTAFIVCKEFLAANGGKLGIKDDPSHAPVLRGIREGFYTHKEIKEWIRHGKIKPFER